MTFRFRKTIRIIPGIRANVSKSGTSLSVGKAGATMNYNGKRTSQTVGLPGTGLSYSQDTKGGNAGLMILMVLLSVLSSLLSLIFGTAKRRR